MEGEACREKGNACRVRVGERGSISRTPKGWGNPSGRESGSPQGSRFAWGKLAGQLRLPDSFQPITVRTRERKALGVPKGADFSVVISKSWREWGLRRDLADLNDGMQTEEL
jgi:hypothetical protein